MYCRVVLIVFCLQELKDAHNRLFGSDRAGNTLWYCKLSVDAVANCIFNNTVSQPGVTVSLDAARLVLTNGYIRIEFDRQHPAIDVLAASYEGEFARFVGMCMCVMLQHRSAAACEREAAR